MATVTALRVWLPRAGSVLLVALSVASVLVMTVYVVEQRRITLCQSTYNEAFRLADIERVQAAAADRAAIRDFLTALGRPDATPQTRAEAYRSYLHRLDEADERRDANPLPTERCI